MIEKSFNDITGFSDKNTFYQLDQWETQTLHGAKNRYIYDFSFPALQDKTYEESLAAFEQKLLTNLSPSANFSNYGTPGGKAEYVGSLGTDLSINQDEGVISVNQDTLMFLNARKDTVFATQFAEKVEHFRSGYVEFTIKTNKQNCIIASGSSQVDASDLNAILWMFGSSMNVGTTISTLFEGDTVSPLGLVSEDYPYYRADSFDGALFNLNLIIKDGKLAVEYYDEFNRDDVNFLFVGNEFIADNSWHHVVINFGRPGLIKQNGTKFNKKFVEIWVDGNLDKRFDDKVNEYQIFYPTVKWLFNNVKDVVFDALSMLDIETNMDIRGFADGSALDQFGSGSGTERTIGNNEFEDRISIFNNGVASSNFAKNAFQGSIHTFAHGINIPISQYEIKRRLRLWKKETKKFAKTLDVNASFVMPTVTTNSKKALRLFWDGLLDNAKDGLELDKNFQVETLSVINMTSSSKTENLNLDTAINKKETKVLQDVRVVLTDNVLVNGPGMVWFANTQEALAMNNRDMHATQVSPKARGFDSVQADLSTVNRFVGPRTDLVFSGIVLNSGDRILLTNQIKTEENGIWIYNGLDRYLTRATDSLISDSSKINVVYITEGYFSGTYWKLTKTFDSLTSPQKWVKVNVSDLGSIYADFTTTSSWKDYHGESRLIDINYDVDLAKYDVVTFVNYPERNEQIYEMFPNDTEQDVIKMYKNFIASLIDACSDGANLFVSSPKLAEDLGIVKKFIKIGQEIEDGDGRSAVVNPFQFGEPAERYFDTHRQNYYHVDTVVPGLTNKETWVLTEAINYIPKDEYDYEQWHLKYSYKQFGLQEGNEFIVPSLPIRQVATKDYLPGIRDNARLDGGINVVAPQDVLVGTVVTSLANNHYHGSTVVANEFDDHATTIIVHNGQLLRGKAITGKIFVNCIEDGYTMSRKDYNKAIIQVIPTNDPYETNSTKQWQYSTSRLNRLPKRVNVKELTNYGQTTPTNGGGGPLVQAATNSSNGIIRSVTDSGNKDYQSDLYPQESEEVYTLQEIPVLSMTWLGLQWLAGN